MAANRHVVLFGEIDVAIAAPEIELPRLRLWKPPFHGVSADQDIALLDNQMPKEGIGEQLVLDRCTKNRFCRAASAAKGGWLLPGGSACSPQAASWSSSAVGCRAPSPPSAAAPHSSVRLLSPFMLFLAVQGRSFHPTCGSMGYVSAALARKALLRLVRWRH
jgi:hypothetical protein